MKSLAKAKLRSLKDKHLQAEVKQELQEEVKVDEKKLKVKK